jgi:hypothetical protein
MSSTRFTCTLTRHDDIPCQSNHESRLWTPKAPTAPGCPRHAVAALNGLTGAHVDWADCKGLNEWEHQALNLAQERSKLTSSEPTTMARLGHFGLV